MADEKYYDKDGNVEPPPKPKRKYIRKPLPPGAPTKCTKANIERICNFIRIGADVKEACASIGVNPTTYYSWLKWGSERPRSIYKQFSDAAIKAHAEYEIKALATLDKAATGCTHALLLKDENGNQLYDKDGLPLFIKPQGPDWQAEAWKLERRFPQRWSKTEKQEINTNQGPAVQITLPSNTRELPAANETVQVDEAVPVLPASNQDTE